MKYLNESHLMNLGIDWKDLISVIKDAVISIDKGDFAQPIKPYLRFKDQSNRIIAMPAYIGGETDAAGIKWIASFPKNHQVNKKRAHSVVILNDTETGEPKSIINTPLLSSLRTAAVTGVVLDTYLQKMKDADKKLVIGIIGFGPIGQQHLSLITQLYEDRIEKVILFDIAGIDHSKIEEKIAPKVEIAQNWEELFDKSDALITCTVSSKGYINAEPQKGRLYLNVSLRDFDPVFKNYVDTMIVDDWKEVCRENTDIENMHLQQGLQEEDTITIQNAVFHDKLNNVEDKVVMFNPMGLGVFDIAVGNYFYNRSMARNEGVVLTD